MQILILIEFSFSSQAFAVQCLMDILLTYCSSLTVLSFESGGCRLFCVQTATEGGRTVLRFLIQLAV